MPAGLGIAELAWLAGILLLAGAAAGFLAGVFGVGGGGVLVPVLYELFGLVGVPVEVRMPLCIGTSLAIIVPTSIRSYRAHLARGAVDTSVLRQWALPVVAGVIAGSVVARHAPDGLFKLVFVAVAGVSAVRLLFGRNSWRIATDFPRGLLMKTYGFMIGILSTLMGIGGGQLSNLLMTFHGRPIHQSVATSSGLGVLISIPGALGYVYAGWTKAVQFPDVAALQFPFALGFVSLIGAVLVMPTSLAAAPLGARLAHAMSKRGLEISFGVFLLIVCARFLASLLAPLMT
jgi:uncharacterized membrane protein YfcA